MARVRSARKPETPANMGRPPTPYDPAVGLAVLEEMAKGEKSLRAICEDNGYPDRSVIYRWVLENRDFSAMFTQARTIQQHSHADEIIRIAETEKDVAKARNMIDARKWTASRLLPTVYGDHINHDHTLRQDAPVDTNLLKHLDTEEREALRTLLLAAQNRAEQAARDEAADKAGPQPPRKQIEGVVNRRKRA